MKLIDKLASPTLAHLYLSQGHFERAADTIEKLLTSNPTNGEVLSLQERLLQCNTARLQSKVQGLALQLHWNTGHMKMREEQALSIELVVFRPTRHSAASAEHQSFSIAPSTNHQSVSLPEGPASACARLCVRELVSSSAVASDLAPRLRTLAISRIHSW